MPCVICGVTVGNVSTTASTWLPTVACTAGAPPVTTRLPLPVQRFFFNRALKVVTGEMTAYGLPKPDHKLLEAHPTVSSELLSRLGAGDITVKPPIDRFDEYYIPATLTAQDYPAFIKPGEKVETLGVQTVLAVYNWPKDHDRYRRVQRFIERYFDLFEKLHK